MHRSRIAKLFVKNPNGILDVKKKNTKVSGIEEEFMEKPDFIKIADIKLKSTASKGATAILSLPKLIISNAMALPRRIILSPIVIYSALERLFIKQQVKAKFKKMFAPMSELKKMLKVLASAKSAHFKVNAVIADVLRKQVSERRASRKRIKAKMVKSST